MKNKVKWAVLAVLVAVAGLIGLSSCQGTGPASAEVVGTITGIVFVENEGYGDGYPAPGLTVRVAAASSKSIKSSVTDEYGYFEINNVAPGEYGVQVWYGLDLLVTEYAYIPTLGEFLEGSESSANISADVGVTGDYNFTYNMEIGVPELYAPIASTNLSDPIAPDANIVITFTKSINKERFKAQIGYDSVDVTVSWSGRTVTLNPVEVLSLDTSYSVYFDELIAEDGSMYSGSAIDFDTMPAIELVSTNFEPVADENVDNFVATDNVILTFSDGITSFDAAETFLLHGSVSSFNDFAIVPADIEVDSTDSTKLVFDPTNSLHAGTPYWVVYSVTADSGYTDDSTSGSTYGNRFWVADEEVTIAPEQVMNFALETDTDTIDYDTTSLSFSWDRVSGAEKYWIYAVDAETHTEEVVVGVFTDGGDLDYNDDMTQTVVLQNIGGAASFDFDAAPSDGTVQPFAWANEITFSAAAINDAGEGTRSSTVMVEDGVVPTVVTTGTLDAVTASGSDLTDSVTLTFSEFLDAGSLSIAEAITDANVTYTYTWSSASIIVITVTIPDGSSLATGDSLTVSFSDQNGNDGTDEVIAVP